jgi:heme exporter protein D
MMTGNHIFYIPMMIMIGLVIGFVLGRRSMAAEIEYEQRRAARKEARQQRKAERSTAGGGEPE